MRSLLTFKTFQLFLLACSVIVSARESADPATVRAAAVDSIWNRGVAFLDSGRLRDGLRLTDSIYGYLENDSGRVTHYISKIFQKFILSGSASDSVLLMINGKSAINDTLNLSTFNFRIGSTNGKKNMLPNFSFNFIFPVEKPYHLIFKGLNYHASLRLKTGEWEIDDLLCEDLLGQSLLREDSISCTIFIDPSLQVQSLYEYIGTFVQGVYDSIEMKRDLKKYRAISLRGYRYAWSREHGRYSAVVAFDKPLADRKGKGIEPLFIRYTIIVKSNVVVCDYAEVKLQKILRIF
ncbi:MAG: hypothetical protein JW915_08735 [Chitinispirillaceae bacterium]|nr:hypothetical protein [Chitinispirillaceae bacterium]